MSKKISIVTISYNAEKTIENTLRSVLNQTYDDFEYIIKDGGSSDNTNVIVNKYKSEFEKKKIPMTHIVSRDNGIYAAMNQAIDSCNGQWIQFINADDELFDNTTLEQIFSITDYHDVDIIYGHTCVKLDKKYRLVQMHNHEELKERFSLGHQSCIVKTELMRKYKFDEKLKVAADYDFFLKMFVKHMKFQKIDIIVSLYSREGVSNSKKDICFIENYKVRDRYNEGVFKGKKTFKSDLKKYRIKRWITQICPKIEILFFCKNNMSR